MLDQWMLVFEFPGIIEALELTKRLEVADAKLGKLFDLGFGWLLVNLRIQFFHLPPVVNPGIIENGGLLDVFILQVFPINVGKLILLLKL